jgi:magnesium and cobalt transporter
MSDDSPDAEHRRPLLERLASLLLRVPEDREQLLTVLRGAHSRAVLDAEALSMIEGVLEVSELSASDVMVPRTQMDVIDISELPDRLLPKVIEAGRSRFPVVDGDRDNVVGILHAKQLLRLYGEDSVSLRELLRPAVFIPESKRLDALLHDFRSNRNHLAIVVDEYGGTAGLVTIEDVLEQIVGEIEDEFDLDQEADHIVPVDETGDGHRWRVRAIAGIRHLNEIAGAELSDEDADTVGGLVTSELGRVPQRGDSLELQGLRFEVLRADARQIQLLLVERMAPAEAEARP